ncbi:50S ribosomal protein L18a [Candidatus Micrarchaeota archaeon]|nr:50S ribosomal protein L18a [Candidatus Micrarchaeota archaeon]
MEFTISGTLMLGKERRTFAKTVDAQTEKAATERVYALFGSENGVKRNNIKIEKIEKG